LRLKVQVSVMSFRHEKFPVVVCEDHDAVAESVADEIIEHRARDAPQCWN